MRAIAVLCMVEVHTAAIIPPEGISVGHPAAFVAAAFGGMAAPMFVAISGWGIHMSAIRRAADPDHNAGIWLRWLAPRILLLSLCQLLVNLLLSADRGGRFEWQTPGVLTLLAIGALLAPVLIRLSMRSRALLMLVMMATPLALGDISGPDWSWWERVGSEGVSEWLARLLWNGTYPAVPWLGFVLLGSLIYDLADNPAARERGIVLGLAATTVTAAIAAFEEIPWALTEGEAVLTFFPASTAFLVVSGTFVLLAHRALEESEARGDELGGSKRLAYLEPAGRITLTIYVAHFAVLGAVASAMQGEPRLELVPAFAATIVHTLVWIPLAIWHQKHIPNISFENLLKRLS